MLEHQVRSLPSLKGLEREARKSPTLDFLHKFFTDALSVTTTPNPLRCEPAADTSVQQGVLARTFEGDGFNFGTTLYNVDAC